MSYEAARQVLSARIAELQNRQDSVDRSIKHTEQELAQHKQAKVDLLAVIKETAAALQALGGPIPDWTDDAELIAFWDEVKDA